MSKKIRKMNIFNWLIVIAIMGLIFYFSSQNGDISSDQSSGSSRYIFETFNLSRLFFFDSFHSLVRKVAHFSIYFSLGFFIYNAFVYNKSKKLYKYIIYTILLVCIYAISDEIHQLFVIGRSGEIRDIIIDTCGGSVGSMFYFICLKIGFGKYDIQKR